MSGIYLEGAPEDHGLRQEVLKPGAPGHLVVGTSAQHSSAGKSSPFPSVLHKHPWVTLRLQGHRSIPWSLQMTQFMDFGANSTVIDNSESGHVFRTSQKFCINRNHFEGGMSPETHQPQPGTAPVGASSLELPQVTRGASRGTTATRNPLCQSSQFPVLFLRVLRLRLLPSPPQMAL